LDSRNIWIRCLLFFSVLGIWVGIVIIQFASASAGASKATGPQSSYTLITDSSRFTLRSQKADVRTILRDISVRTGIPIEIGPALDAIVTIDLFDVSLETLITKLTGNTGIAYQRITRAGTCQYRIQHITVARTRTDQPGSAPPQTPPPLPSDRAVSSEPVPPPGQTPPRRIAHPETNRAPPAFRPDELVVKFNETLTREQIQSIILQAGLTIKQQIPAIRYYTLAIPPGLSLETLQKQFNKITSVTAAEPNYLIPIQFIPSDIHFSNQWALHNTGQTGGTVDADIDAPDAWALGTPGNTITIAVIDTGIDYTHPDLAGIIWQNPGEIPGNGIDDDGNGYTDDHMGWDFVDAATGAPDEDFYTPDNDPMDRHGHGTQVAGIIGAVSDNGIGISGVSRNCRIMPVRAGYKTFGGDAVLESVDAANAIIYAADNGASILNLSWGDGLRSAIIADAIEYAGSNGVLTVAAAGNENAAQFLYPAALDNAAVISVGATDDRDQKAGYSNYGDWVDVSAPGTSIYTTGLNHGYGYVSGTSMATAHVSGLAAMIIGHDPGLSMMGVKSRILLSGDYLPGLEGRNLTAGRINAHSAVTQTFTDPHIFSLSPTRAHAGDTITIFGNRFDNVQAGGRVVFTPGVTGLVHSWSDNEIVSTVPESAGTGPVRVDTGSGLSSNTVDFTLLERYYTETLTQQQFSGGGIARGWQADEQSWAYTLPFDFPFYGQTYRTVYICSNGYLDFTSSDAAHRNSVEAMTARTMIAPFWTDLTTAGFLHPGQDIYIHSPTPDSVCIRWAAEIFDTENPVNFEVVLHQNGTIAFHYGTGNTGASPTIGISAGTGQALLIGAHDNNSDLHLAQSLVFEPLAGPPVPDSFTIALDPGWNLVSLPVIPDKLDITDILGDIMHQLESIWGFNNGMWEFYSPKNPGFSNLDNMAPKRGYWIQTGKSGLTFTVQGPVDADTIHVLSGWNLVGWGILQPVPVQTALADIDGEVKTLWAYKNGRWRVFDTDNPGLSDLQTVAPGVGYWVFLE